MNASTSRPKNVRGTTAVCLFLGLAAVTLFSTGLMITATPHLHDYGEWMFQGAVLALKLTDPARVAGYELAAYPVPNSLVTVSLAALNLVFSPLLAGKVLLLLLIAGWCIVGWMFAARFFEDMHQAALAWLLIVCVAGFSNFFWYGFISYQFGAVLFLAFLARYRSSTSALEVALFGIALFFAHAIPFLLFGLLVAIAVIIMRFPLGHLLALAPSALLSAWFLWGRLAGGLDPGPAAARWAGAVEMVVYKLGTATMLGPFRNFLLPDGSALLESLPPVYWAGVAVNVAVTALLGLLVLGIVVKQVTRFGLQRRSGDLRAALLVFCLLVAALFLIAPHNFFGMENPGVRMLLPLLFAAIALLPSSGLRLPLLAVLPVAFVTIFSVSAYTVSLLNSEAPGVAFERHEKAPPEVRGSVLRYNEWLYRHTRYSYYNYRVFAFEHRLERLRNDDYKGLGFRTGVILSFSPGAND